MKWILNTSRIMAGGLLHKEYKMVILGLFLSCLMIAYNSMAQTKINADKIIGIYLSPKKDAKIEIYKKSDKYFGKTIWNAKPGKDSQNPDKSLRNRDIVGSDFLTNFIYDDGDYVNGKVYDPRNGKSYDCRMTVKGDILRIRGFIGIPTFGKTESFKRITN